MTAEWKPSVTQGSVRKSRYTRRGAAAMVCAERIAKSLNKSLDNQA